jgi:hypothetical protein
MSTVERACAAHGEIAGARAIRAAGTGAGLLFRMKTGTRGVELSEVVADLHTQRLEQRDWPRPGQVGIYTPQRVSIETSDGEVLSERARPREHMPLRWDDLSFLYFSGYALWNYFATPWLLRWPGVQVVERGGGRIDVTFPPEIHTHSTRQRFWFDEDDGLLRRLDYTAEVVGRWALGTHRVLAFKTADGLTFPSHRRVAPRFLPGPTLVELHIRDAALVVER